jgi:drug/metabolite transporter (DMT)-like permease
LVCLATGNAGVNWTPFVITSILIQGVVIAFLSLLLWFWLLRHYLASRVSIFTFLTPLLGVTFGVWILDDPLHPEFVWGALMVLSGMILVNIPKKKQQVV